MPKVQGEEDREGDVVDEEVRGGEFAREEDVEAVCYGEDDDHEEGEVGCVGLEGGFVGEGVEEVVEVHGAAELL